MVGVGAGGAVVGVVAGVGGAGVGGADGVGSGEPVGGGVVSGETVVVSFAWVAGTATPGGGGAVVERGLRAVAVALEPWLTPVAPAVTVSADTTAVVPGVLGVVGVVAVLGVVATAA